MYSQLSHFKERIGETFEIIFPFRKLQDGMDGCRGGFSRDQGFLNALAGQGVDAAGGVTHEQDF